MSKEISKKEQAAVANQVNLPKGFEDEQENDMIIPRVKLIQSLSPERKDKLAEEGDIINSLTMEKLNGKVFVPVFKFNSNIEWVPRTDGGGIACHARTAKVGTEPSGVTKVCAVCRRNEWDNSKQGRDAIPKCTKYINFFGFIEGEKLPLILSFAKTNYNEGKKMYSLAKVTMQNMWHNGYKLQEKTQAKNGNEWFIIDVAAAGPVSEEDRNYGAELYASFREASFIYDMDESTSSKADIQDVDADEATEY